MAKKKTWLILLISLLVLSIVIVICILLNNSNTEQPIDNIKKPVYIQGESKLDKYINSLEENYYIKYYGKFKNNYGEAVDAVVEYTKDGNNFGLRSTEIDMYIVCEGEKLYTISHRYKLIVQMARENFKTHEYNWVSQMGQVYVNSYKEKIKGTTYDVEEYSYNGKTLKYYFNDVDIKFVYYDNQEIRVIRVEKKTNTELLVRPTDYKYAIA